MSQAFACVEQVITAAERLEVYLVVVFFHSFLIISFFEIIGRSFSFPLSHVSFFCVCETKFLCVTVLAVLELAL